MKQTSDESDDLESQDPLQRYSTALSPPPSPASQWDDPARSNSAHQLRDQIQEGDRILDRSAFYSADEILSWAALYHVSGSVWNRKSLHMVLVRMLILASISGTLIIWLVDNPVELSTGKFLKVSQFLNVFVGLLIGFSIKSSITRWYDCAGGFLQLCYSIRHLQRELFALGVDDATMHRIIRYGVMSGYLLDIEMTVAALSKDQLDDAKAEMWKVIKIILVTREHEEKYAAVTHDEKTVLRTVQDPSMVVWMWIATLIGELSKDLVIPPRASPTYCRLMGLCDQARRGIRDIHSAVVVQPPYLYFQLLATLVHVNNIINAVSFGFIFGATISVFLEHQKGVLIGTGHRGASLGDCARDGQSLLLSFVFSCGGPFLYQALLEVAVAVSQPFSSAEGSVPTRWLLARLEEDLDNCIRLGKWMREYMVLPVLSRHDTRRRDTAVF